MPTACTSPAPLTGLAQGMHAFAVRATDAAGHDDPSPATRSWTVDTVAPEVAFTAGPGNATIGASDRAGAAEAAAAFADDGFECVKVKVGVGDDAARVAAVRRAVGDGVALRLDANGAWTVE